MINNVDKDRVVLGQFESQKYGMRFNDENGETFFQVDSEGNILIKGKNVKISFTD